MGDAPTSRLTAHDWVSKDKVSDCCHAFILLPRLVYLRSLFGQLDEFPPRDSQSYRARPKFQFWRSASQEGFAFLNRSIKNSVSFGQLIQFRKRRCYGGIRWPHPRCVLPRGRSVLFLQTGAPPLRWRADRFTSHFRTLASPTTVVVEARVPLSCVLR